MSIHKRVASLALWAIFVSIPVLSIAEEAKLQELKEKGAAAPVLKSLDADNKRLAEQYKQLMIKEGYIKPEANCTTVCTVSCTWVNGVCQPTTSCSLQCGF